MKLQADCEMSTYLTNAVEATECNWNCCLARILMALFSEKHKANVFSVLKFGIRCNFSRCGLFVVTELHVQSANKFKAKGFLIITLAQRSFTFPVKGFFG
jgi:hypothetical protein